MIAVVQRVSKASVKVEEPPYLETIKQGLCILLGVEEGDTKEQAKWIAGKLARLRIFADEQGKMNHSVQDINGEILLVSQFTLAGDCTKGNRPSFAKAAAGELGKELYEAVGRYLQTDHGLPVKFGVFGAMMNVSIENDGPVTLIVRKTSKEN